MINKKIWDEIILYLLSKEIINDLSYNLWIKDLSVSFKENVITIKFPSSLSKEKFISSFADIIKRTFYEFNQTNVEFKYIVSEKTKENSEKIIDKKENETQQTSSKVANKEDKTLKSDLFRYDQLQYLNPRYTFDNFVIGKNNQFCAAAALRVAQAPGQHMNPLFIYGGVGLGKTHILQAIANHILINNKNLKIIYIGKVNNLPRENIAKLLRISYV